MSKIKSSTRVVLIVDSHFKHYFQIASLVLVTVLCMLFLNHMLMLKKHIHTEVTKQVQSLIVKEPVFFQTVFTDIFPNAATCHSHALDCTTQSRQQLESFYAAEPTSLRYQKYLDQENHLVLAGDLPIYFVRLAEGRLEKLFLSGDLKVETIDTRGEQVVKEVLMQKRSTLEGVFSGPVMNTKYLVDLYSQEEILVPVHDADGNVLGAVVFLYAN